VLGGGLVQGRAVLGQQGPVRVTTPPRGHRPRIKWRAGSMPPMTSTTMSARLTSSAASVVTGRVDVQVTGRPSRRTPIRPAGPGPRHVARVRPMRREQARHLGADDPAPQQCDLSAAPRPALYPHGRPPARPTRRFCLPHPARSPPRHLTIRTSAYPRSRRAGPLPSRDGPAPSLTVPHTDTGGGDVVVLARHAAGSRLPSRDGDQVAAAHVTGQELVRTTMSPLSQCFPTPASTAGTADPGRQAAR